MSRSSFPALKNGTRLWDLHGVTRFRIALRVDYGCVYENSQSHATPLYPLAQRLSNTIEQNINYSLSLLFSKLNLISDLLNDLPLSCIEISEEGAIAQQRPTSIGKGNGLCHHPLSRAPRQSVTAGAQPAAPEAWHRSGTTR